MKNENKNPYSNSDSLRAREHEKKAAALEEKKQNNSKASAIVFGGLFVGTAALYGLKFAGILPGFTLLHLGTLTLIPMIPALISIFAKGPGPVSTPVLLISLYMLAAAQDGLGFLWEIFFPAALLIIGVSILSNSRMNDLCHRIVGRDGLPMPKRALRLNSPCGRPSCAQNTSLIPMPHRFPEHS